MRHVFRKIHATLFYRHNVTRHHRYRAVPELVFPTDIQKITVEPVATNDGHIVYNIAIGQVKTYLLEYYQLFRLKTPAGTVYDDCPSHEDTRTDEAIIEQLVLNHFQESTNRLRQLRASHRNRGWLDERYHRACDTLVRLDAVIRAAERDGTLVVTRDVT